MFSFFRKGRATGGSGSKDDHQQSKHVPKTGDSKKPLVKENITPTKKVKPAGTEPATVQQPPSACGIPTSSSIIASQSEVIHTPVTTAATSRRVKISDDVEIINQQPDQFFEALETVQQPPEESHPRSVDVPQQVDPAESSNAIPPLPPVIEVIPATPPDDSIAVTSMASDAVRMEDRVRQLERELCDKTHRLEQLEAAIQADGDRQAQLETLERFEAEWLKERELLDNEREEELRLLQEALEEALEEKAELESKMLRDASRESQLLDDFEWKLGEIERDYKKKVAEAEKSAEERVKREMAAEYQRLIDDKQDIDKKLSEIAHLKSYEAEVTQLRGLIHEQQRAIRVAARQIDQLRVNERILQDDLKKLSTQGYTRKQQEEMEEKWEEKTQAECNRLRNELLAANEEEVLKAIKQVVREKDDQIAALKRQYETQQVALNAQVAELKKTLQQREAKMAQQLETARTTADRDICDLRRQLGKAQDLHAEVLEQMERKHAEELEKCNGGNKAALEKSFDEKLQKVEIEHQSQLNALQSLIEEEKQEALTQLGDHYRNQMQSLQDHIAELQRKWSESDRRRDEEIIGLRKVITQQSEQISVLQSKTANHRHLANGSNASSDDEEETEDDDDEDVRSSTPPNGRSAGDGCSPPSSTAASQDNLNPIGNQTKQEVMMSPDPVPKHEPMCCEDPDHMEAQQIILEMHQVLADRDAELQRLTEEKRFYQLELIHWERNLALQRSGLPLSLVPDSLCDDPWRGFSAPPVTKPRLVHQQQLIPASAAFDTSRAASYEVLSPGAISLSPEPQHQLFAPAGYPVALFGLDPTMRPPPGAHYYYSDEDDDGNNNGFTTPM